LPSALRGGKKRGDVTCGKRGWGIYTKLKTIYMIKNLFIIDGAAASAKADLIHFLKYKSEISASCVQKYSTKEANEKEETDLIPMAVSEFRIEIAKDKKKSTGKNFYVYRYGEQGKENTYGFYISDIVAKLEEFNNVFIIIRHRDTIQEIKKIFEVRVRVITVFIYIDEKTAKSRLEKIGIIDKDEIKTRLKKLNLIKEDYLANNYTYQKTILHISDISHYRLSIKSMMDYYQIGESEYLKISGIHRYLLPSFLKDSKNRMIDKMEKYPYEKNIFLMVKYRDDNTLLASIKSWIGSRGYNCVIANDNWNITGDRYNSMAVLFCCKYGIALFDKLEPVPDTDKKEDYYNPNVSYELGIMQSQSKDCLILKHSSLPEVPFDINAKLIEEYEKDIQLEKIIYDWIKQLEDKYSNKNQIYHD
jgi:hypothetical protein